MFTECDLTFPTQIVTNNSVPRGVFTVTINPEPTSETFSVEYTVNGDIVFDIALIPVSVDVRPELGTVTISLSVADGEFAGVMPAG